VLKEILAMQLVCVREVQFRHRWDAIDTKRLDERTLKLARRLLSRPTIERVEFRSMYQPAAFFSRLFADTTPQLRELDFDACELYSGEQHKPAPARITPTAAARRVVTHFRLFDSSTLAPWLLGAACPFDFTHLTHADVSSSLKPGLASILRGAANTLRELSLAAGASSLCQVRFIRLTLTVQYTADVDHCPPLGLFPALAHLTLNAYAEVTVFFPMLETLDPANGLCTITLSLWGFGLLSAAQTREQLGNFDARVSKIALPALRRVEVRFPQSSSAPVEVVAFWEAKKMLCVEALAPLAARGVSVVLRIE
jgi:hypothetical protein